MRGKSLLVLADQMAESLMKRVRISPVAVDLADQMAMSLTDELGLDDLDDIAEGLAHLGCGTDEIEDLVRNGLEELAWRLSRKLARQHLPEGLPVAAAAAMGRVRSRAQEAAS